MRPAGGRRSPGVKGPTTRSRFAGFSVLGASGLGSLPRVEYTAVIFSPDGGWWGLVAFTQPFPALKSFLPF